MPLPPFILMSLRKYELPGSIASCVLRKELAPPPQPSVSIVKSLSTAVKEDPNKQLDEHARREISKDVLNLLIRVKLVINC
tara:strand:- start:233 stop:475 length:243 start_codon:yes stop_codon:yes gene_type:complete